MNKLKSILGSLILLSAFMILGSCGNGPDDVKLIEEGEYKGAFEELEKNDGSIKKNRRIGVVREIIKASQEDPDRVEIDKDKLGIE